MKGNHRPQANIGAPKRGSKFKINSICNKINAIRNCCSGERCGSWAPVLFLMARYRLMACLVPPPLFKHSIPYPLSGNMYTTRESCLSVHVLGWNEMKWFIGRMYMKWNEEKSIHYIFNLFFLFMNGNKISFLEYPSVTRCNETKAINYSLLFIFNNHHYKWYGYKA